MYCTNLSANKNFQLLSAAVLFSFLSLSGCSGNTSNTSSTSSENTLNANNTNDTNFSDSSNLSNETVALNPANIISWHWQLQGTLNTYLDVDIYDIDLFDTDKEVIRTLKNDSKQVICYFSAGSYESWRDDADQFSSSILGNDLDGWEGERWLDIRDESLKLIMQNRLDLAREKGCDGVEPDNVDGYVNSTGFDLSYDDQLNYNIFLAKEAHKRGLSIALKNDLEQIKELSAYYDFALNEECFTYDECDELLPFIEQNKSVLIAVYEDKYISNINGERDKICEESLEKGFSTLVLPLELDDSFRYSCDNE
jgi:endo-alpha-1,4-polygalactosaminidase (GH114 family)